ncbi:hypothetical protein ACJIZ3_021171 [Penstemon smallii]|uniref:Arf-GAP domain-containing protein n=1 Tax=Penstemon smallii TaxID=265156 RepID=A0ABD3SLI4_9LAMI
MASRLKEEQKNEKIIRNLLKLPENRKCINCNSLGPQYVCTNFSTFVCTTCSGIHREFTHRVKSVSMAKFTSQEVSALQGGGNASAREIYLKEWDTQRNSLPDGSNIEKLRELIKHVYVDRRYTGERNVEKPLRAKMGESDDLNGNRRIENYQSGSRSPPYEDPERRHSDRPSSAGRSPGYDQVIRRQSENKRSPAPAEVVNDWRREDRFGNGRRSEDGSSDGGSKLEVRSPDSQRSDMSSPPLVRPVRDILGDNISPLRVIEPPKATGAKSIDGSAHTQRTASSRSLASFDGNPSEVKVEASLIDFDSVPTVTATAPPTQVATDGSSVQLAASSGDNWANFDSVPQVKVNTAPLNSVESALFELSIPASTSGPSSSMGISHFQSSGSSGSSFGITAPTSGFPSSGAPPASLGPASRFTNTEGGLLANAPTVGQWPTMNPQQHSMFPGGSGHPVPGLVAPANAGSSSNTPWNPLVAANVHRPPGASVMQMGQAGTGPVMSTSSGYVTEPSSNAKSGGRNELPEDLFAMNYSYNTPPVSGYYSGSPYVAGVPMQYNVQMVLPNSQPVSRSTNPFDFSSEPSPFQAPMFPSVKSLQGALPQIGNPSGLLRTSSLGTTPYHTPSVHTQAPSYASAIPPSSYRGQEIAGNMAPRPQGPSGFSLEDPAFTSLNSRHHLGGLYSAHSAPSNFTSSGGNPFG